MTKLHKEIKEDIKTLSKLMEINNLSELTVSYKELTYNLKRNLSNIRQIEHIVENNDLKEKDKESDAPKTDKSLKSPLVGTAYLSPEPGAKQFIEVGQVVKIGQVLLIIEAMKTMNEIVADRNGKVKKIFIKNESPVEFGEPLVLIE